MQKINLEITIERYAWPELPPPDQHLMQAAQAATDGAYAPYSQFCVGAAVLLTDGTVVRGSNQENAAYPSGLCAERTAIFATGANHAGKRILAVAVTARPAAATGFVAVSPCGACRQALLEYEVRQGVPIRLLVQSDDGHVCVLPSVECLLPLKFSHENLK